MTLSRVSSLYVIPRHYAHARCTARARCHCDRQRENKGRSHKYLSRTRVLCVWELVLTRVVSVSLLSKGEGRRASNIVPAVATYRHGDGESRGLPKSVSTGRRLAGGVRRGNECRGRRDRVLSRGKREGVEQREYGGI